MGTFLGIRKVLFFIKSTPSLMLKIKIQLYVPYYKNGPKLYNKCDCTIKNTYINSL